MRENKDSKQKNVFLLVFCFHQFVKPSHFDVSRFSCTPLYIIFRQFSLHVNWSLYLIHWYLFFVCWRRIWTCTVHSILSDKMAESIFSWMYKIEYANIFLSIQLHKKFVYRALTINRGHIIPRDGKKILYICYIHQPISMRHLRCEVWLKIFPKLLLHWSYILLNSAGPSLDAIFHLSMYSCR